MKKSNVILFAISFMIALTAYGLLTDDTSAVGYQIDCERTVSGWTSICGD